MMTKSNYPKDSAEKTVHDIRRATRRTYSAEEKIQVVLEGLRGEDNFPRRNRTMALLSDASVIVEAGASSGTIHQGWEALRLGRAVFLMHSLVERKELNWPRDMIQYGAQALTETNELLDVLPSALPETELAVAAF
jgi:transposase-like protein